MAHIFDNDDTPWETDGKIYLKLIEKQYNLSKELPFYFAYLKNGNLKLRAESNKNLNLFIEDLKSQDLKKQLYITKYIFDLQLNFPDISDKTLIPIILKNELEKIIENAREGGILDFNLLKYSYNVDSLVEYINSINLDGNEAFGIFYKIRSLSENYIKNASPDKIKTLQSALDLLSNQIPEPEIKNDCKTLLL